MKAGLLIGGIAASAVKVAAQTLSTDSHPDCQNGPLAKNKVCDMTAGKIDTIVIIPLMTLVCVSDGDV
jgi:hypothetical protein